mgnify:FL=1|tara:strand:+ start:300 stop:527 length:228 start_codon:yes stop_codon:yes gene_type:complete
MTEVNMRLNDRENNKNYIFESKVYEERSPGTPVRTRDPVSSDESNTVADMIIRQNQMINRALRRTYRSSVARKAL